VARLHRSLCMVVAVVAALSGVQNAASAQIVTRETRPAYEATYNSAIRCFVANGHARSLRERAGDPAGVARYDNQARRAHELAGRAGNALAYSASQIEQDFNYAIDNELPRMANDNAYFVQTVAGCRALELM
jgi:hypothetical protein